MALTSMKLLKAASTSKFLANPCLLRKSVPVGSVIQRKSLALSPVLQKRVYGPAESGLGESTSHWKMERVASAALLPIIPAAILFPNVGFDYVVSTILIMHTHWGLHSVCTDYIHGNVSSKAVDMLITALSALALGGLFYLNYQDIGFGRAVQLAWKEL